MSFNLVQLKPIESRCYVPVIEYDATKIQFFAYLSSDTLPNPAKPTNELVFSVVNLMDLTCVNNYNQLIQEGSFVIISVDRISKEVVVKMDAKVLSNDGSMQGAPLVLFKLKNLDDITQNIDGAPVLSFPGATTTKFKIFDQKDKDNFSILRKFCDIPSVLCNDFTQKVKRPFNEQAASCGFSITASVTQLPSFLSIAGRLRKATPQDFNAPPSKQLKASKDACLVM